MQEAFGIKDESAFKAASGLHGGIGGKRDVCGALLGASMMVGLMFGGSIEESGKPKPPPKPGQTSTPSRLTAELYKWFKKEFGSVKCRSIQKRHFNEVNAEPDAAGLTEMERMERIFDKCNLLTAKTAAKAAEMIYDEEESGKKIGDH